MTLGLLVSGELGFVSLKYLIENYQVNFVMTDKNSKQIIDFCERNSIDTFYNNPRNSNSSDFIKDRTIDVLVSINYLYIIEQTLIDLPKKLAYNIHGSLLPKYRGRTPHVWAIINNEKETGITAHVIEAGCDTGDIIEQIKVPIDIEDTGASILEKFKLLYIPLVDNVLRNILLDTLQRNPQNHSKATTFGKRTPEDGQINWNWQKERIFNWVRAQAHPYPGAFSLYEDDKIIIDEIKFSDFGFDSKIENGTILKDEPLTIKTPNGAVEIVLLRDPNKKFRVNTLMK